MAVRNSHSPTLLYTMAMFDTLIWGVYTPVLPSIHRRLSISPRNVGLIASFYSLVSLFMSPLLGFAADRYGKRIMLILGNFTTFLGIFLCLVATIEIDYQEWLEPKSSNWLTKGLDLSTIDIRQMQYMVGRCLPAVFRCGMLIIQASLSSFDEDLGSSGVQQNIIDLDNQLGPTKDKTPIGGTTNVIQKDSDDHVGTINRRGLEKQGETDAEKQKQMLTSQRLSRLAVCTSMAFIAGPVLGGQLSAWSHDTDSRIPNPNSSSTSLCLWAAAALSLTNMVISLFAYIPQRESKAATKTVDSQEIASSNRTNIVELLSQNRELIFLFHLKFVFMIGNCIYETMFAQLLESELGFSVRSIGWSLSYVGLVTTLVNAFFVDYAVKKIFSLSSQLSQRLIGVVIFAHALGLMGWALSSSVVGSMLSSAVVALTTNVIFNILQTKLASLTPDGARARILGISASVDRASKVAAPLIGGFGLHWNGAIGLAIVSSLPSLYCSLVTVCSLSSESTRTPIPILSNAVDSDIGVSSIQSQELLLTSKKKD